LDNIVDAREKENFVNVSECWKLCSIADCTVNIKESMEKLKSLALNGYQKKFCSEAANDFQGLHNQQDEIKNILVLACKVLGEGFPELEEANILEFLNSHTAELTEEEPEELMVLSETKGEGDSDAVVERP
jgi:hypothetical protein